MFKIIGKCKGQPWEDIDEADTREEAETLLKEYQMAFGKDFLLDLKEEA